MALQQTTNAILNCYDSNMRNNYYNGITKTYIMYNVLSHISKLNSIPNVQYSTIMEGDYDYGLSVTIKTNKFNFKIFAKVHNIIHKNYNENYVIHLDNSHQTRLENDYNLTKSMITKSNFDEIMNVDDNFEPFDASWKLYYNDKKPATDNHNHNHNSNNNTQQSKTFRDTIFSKIKVATKQNHDYYAKNTMSMINYIETICNSINQVNSDVNSRSVTCNWSMMIFENFIATSIMLNIKAYFEEREYVVIILDDVKYDLSIAGDVVLSYDMTNNKIIMHQIIIIDKKMSIATKDVYDIVEMYLARKPFVFSDFERSKKK